MENKNRVIKALIMGNILIWNDNGKMRIYTENGVVVVLISIYKGNRVIVITMKSVDRRRQIWIKVRML